MAIKKEDRKLYKINYVAEVLGVTPRTIRYYDQLNLLPHVKRSEGGIRLFDDEDIAIIKKIRHIQKEDLLPLEVIRRKLFGKPSAVAKLKRVIVSDNSATFSTDIQTKLNIHTIPMQISIKKEKLTDDTVLPQDLWKKCKAEAVTPVPIPVSVEALEKKYLELQAQGFNEIYSVHISSTLSDSFQNAQKAAKLVADKIHVNVIDSKSFGPGHRALVYEISEAIQKNASKEEISLLISKTLPLNYVLILTNASKQVYPNMHLQTVYTPHQTKMVETMMTFKALMVFKGSTNDLETISWHKDKEQTIEAILEVLTEEIVSRGKYIKRILIDSRQFNEETAAIKSALTETYQNSEIRSQKSGSYVSSFFGPETIYISIS